MNATLDVLLLESGPGDGLVDSELLTAAGHRVHRCHDVDGPSVTSHPAGSTPCRVLTEGTCPLDGRIDVALLVRRGVAPRPGPDEAGVPCAVRAGVPIVEDGTDLLDPFDPWISRRTDAEGVVAACESAARDAMLPALEQVRSLVAPLLEGTDVRPDDLTARFSVDGDHLLVQLDGPTLPERTMQAICVRMVDALRVLPRSFSTIDLSWAPVDEASSVHA